ncbi:MAG: hypothetical protein RIQ71_551 [Verrucomicrobiota bacterium]|jgi:hypothetical protein
MRPFACAALLFFAAVCPASAQWPWQLFQLLQPDGKIDPSLITECSGLVQSLRYSGVFWALGDSGSGAVVVPVTARGDLAPGWSGPVRVEGWKNYDWEDLALDGRGNMIIADVGNNSGSRKQLMLHFVREPKPGSTVVRPDRSLRVHYEDQKEASPDFDCEAVFCTDDRVFFLTKRRSDGRTVLYRLAGDSPNRSNPLRRVSSFNIGGMATAADVSPDGKLVAVLTYTAVWLFEYDHSKGDIFSGGARRIPFFAWQAEGLAFDGNESLVVANEQGQLFRLRTADFETVRP